MVLMREEWEILVKKWKLYKRVIWKLQNCVNIKFEMKTLLNKLNNKFKEQKKVLLY